MTNEQMNKIKLARTVVSAEINFINAVVRMWKDEAEAGMIADYIWGNCTFEDLLVVLNGGVMTVKEVTE